MRIAMTKSPICSLWFTMRHLRVAVLLVLIVLMFSEGGAGGRRSLRRSKRNNVQCRPKTLVRYRITVYTLWSKQTFPKMYPTYRPHAQWSALVGRTHSPDFKMWQEDENSTYGVKVFAETGDQSYLDVEAVQGYDNVLDTFVAPPIGRGVGETSAVITFDGSHSQLSFLMRIIPSPDWFVGINGLDLCSHGRWQKEVQVDLSPMDAGTDEGFTFSAPNWPNEPPVPISAITSSFPDHPASSFYYPDLKELPRIAFVKLDLVAEYRQRRIFMEIRPTYNITRAVGDIEKSGRGTDEDVPTEEGHNDVAIQSLPNIETQKTHPGENEIQLDEQGRETQIPVTRADKSTQMFQSDTSQRDMARLSEKTTDDELTDDSAEKERVVDGTAKPVPAFHLRELMIGSAKVPRKPSREVATLEPLANISPKSFENPQFHEVSTRHNARAYENTAIDCEVEEWAEWSPCTVTCGFGKRERTREVSKYPSGDGAMCPRLRQEALCGSMRNCRWDHFSLLSPRRTMREGRIRRRRGQ